jgi:L-lactate dehydrogenase complex protein LldG
MQRPNGAEARAPAIKEFLAGLGGLHVETHVASTEAQATEALKGILSTAGCHSVVVAGIPAPYRALVKSGISGVASTAFIEDLQGKPTKEVVSVLASADAGVTWAVNGLAMEGALLEIVYDDSFKLASSLPIIHIAMMESSSIIRDLSEALPLIGDAISKSPPARKPIISFISGPSKTGDIEMRLLYGVHGPHTVHVILLDWNENGGS